MDQPRSLDPIPESERLSTFARPDDTATRADAASAAIPQALDARPIYYDTGWLSSFLRPTLIALMTAALNVTLLMFMRRFMPSLGSGYLGVLTALGVIASLVGCTTTTWIAQPNQRKRRTPAYRLAELGLLLVSARVIIWAVTATWPTLYLFVTRPLATLLDGLYLVAVAVVTISWVIATDMTGDLQSMALQPDELALLATDGVRTRDSLQPVATDRVTLLGSFTGRWVTGGMILVMLAAGTRVTIGSRGFFALTRQEIPGLVIAAIVIYFLAGLVLLSHGQLALLRARWTLDKIPSSDAVARSWPLYVTLLVLLVGLIAAVMPFGGTYWLAVIISTILAALYLVFFTVFQLITVMFMLLLSWLPFGAEESTPPAQAAPMMPPPPPPGEPSALLEWASGTIFWIFAAVIVGYAAIVYFGDKGLQVTWLRRLWEMLRWRWRTLGQSFQSWRAHLISDNAQAGAPGTTRRGPVRRGWRKLEPDAQIRALYHALLEDAKEFGTPRQRGETPLRYEPRLIDTLDQHHRATGDEVNALVGSAAGAGEGATPHRGHLERAKAGIDAVTRAFVAVRYGRKTFSAEEVAPLEQSWRDVRHQLRK